MIPILLALFWLADVRECACDAAHPDTLEARPCSLCKAAELQPPVPGVFFLKDTNPAKPNRVLALPRAHYPGAHSLGQMIAAERTELWTAAIAKAKELWGTEWGLAYNGDERRNAVPRPHPHREAKCRRGNGNVCGGAECRGHPRTRRWHRSLGA